MGCCPTAATPAPAPAAAAAAAGGAGWDMLSIGAAAGGRPYATAITLGGYLL